MAAKVTMKDVARHAGVSVATVSNVLNNRDNKANEVTTRKIMKAVKELNYQMDMTAKSLASGKSKLIGIFLPETYESGRPTSLLKDNPFFSEIISGIEYEARLQDYDVVVACIKNADHVRKLVAKRTLDGIAVLGHFQDDFWEELKALTLPKVLIDSYKFEELHFCNVGINDENAAYLATRHLITMGHRKVALVTSEIMESSVNYYRYLGYKRAIEESSLEEADCPIIVTGINFKGGVQAGHTLLNTYPQVTAAFAVADIIALGIIKLYHQIGKNIPKDLSLIGFDDLSVCQYSFPGLTTIRQDIFQKGVEVAKLLLANVNGDNEIKEIELPVELIMRQTVQAVWDY